MQQNVFGYLRVSGRDQIDGDGFGRQRAAIQAFCDRKGWVVLRWFEEKGVSGETASEHRPAYTEMLGLCGPTTAMVVVVERADRLARDLMVSELACQTARECDVKIFEAASDTNLTDNSDPTRILIRQVLGALAEWNKNVLVSRLRAARERKRKDEGRCEGPVPFCVRNTETASLALRLSQEGWSLQDIAKELNRRGVTTPGTYKARGILDIGMPQWTRSSVQHVLRSTRREFKRQDKIKDPVRGAPVLVGLDHLKI